MEPDGIRVISFSSPATRVENASSSCSLDGYEEGMKTQRRPDRPSLA